MDKELFLMDEQRYLFLEMKSTFGEYPVKIVEMTTKDLDYYISWVYKTVTGFDMIDSNFEKKVLQWVKSYQTALNAAEKLFLKRRVNWCGQLHGCLIFRNFQSHPTFSSHRQRHNQQKDCDFLKAPSMISIFSIFKLSMYIFFKT